MTDLSREKQRYENIFDDMGEDWEAVVNSRDTEREAEFVQNVISGKGKILDLCCGTCRHSIVLRKNGWDMIGLDLSRNLLTIGKRRMKKEGVELPLVRADMRYFPFRNDVFRAVICMFTSFGYLPSDDEDVKCLREICRTLQRGGLFLLDVINRDHLIKIFHEREWAEFEPFYMLEKRSLDPKATRLLSEWTIIQKNTGVVRSLQHNLHIYTFDRLNQMLDMAGFKVRQLYGGYDKKGFSQESSRMIVLAQKTVPFRD